MTAGDHGLVVDRINSKARALVGLVRAAEYFAVGSNPRFRAVERRVTWNAARAALLVIAAGAPLHILVLGLLHRADASFIAEADAALGSLALVAWCALGRVLRHHAEAIAFVMSLAVGAASMVLGATGPRMIELSIGYLLFIPPLVALVLPWRTWTELRWLAIYGGSVVWFFAIGVPERVLTSGAREDLVFAVIVSLAAALTGHVLVFRRNVRSFVQVQALGRLQRRESHQRAELQLVYRSLEVTARTDELTGAGNRLRLDEDLRAARGRLGRTGARFGLLEIDLDHFKAINDSLGHLAGDQMLRRVAEVIRGAVRSDDALYRYGGEEFIVILGTVSGGVLEPGERIRSAVHDLALLHPGNPPFGRVTVSVGAASLGPGDAAQTADEWFGRVDAALYRAKAGGRNMVVVAPISAVPVDDLPIQLERLTVTGRAIERPL